jgi:DNA-binding NtrC family response regulator
VSHRPLVCLIVEDQAPVAQALEVLFSLHDVPARVVPDADAALDAVRTGAVGVVLQDMNFAPGETSGDEGAALFHAIRALDPAMPVLLMTAFTSLERAVSLVKAGATDYFGKPWDDARLVESVHALIAMRRAADQTAWLACPERSRGGEPALPWTGGAHGEESREGGPARPDVRPTSRGTAPDLRGIVYRSQSMRRVVDLAVHVASADVPVLITGPNGVGKEKIAEIIQANSRRAGRPFVTVNVGALPDTLLEAELFGAEAGAFTGAQRRRIGRFEAANGGTLFLDEIGTLSMAGQARLLRVLQTGEYERLGSSTTLRSDVRLLCATNVHLPEAIAAGRFREDLYFRLNVIELAIPALRERPDDILPIAHALLARAGSPAALSAAAEQALVGHGWPGNVRELQNRLQRARLVATGPEITVEDLDLAGVGRVGTTGPTAGGAGPTSVGGTGPTDEGAGPTAGGAERHGIEDVLRRHGGSVSRAAEALGLSRQALYRRMERLGVSIERRPRS